MSLPLVGTRGKFVNSKEGLDKVRLAGHTFQSSLYLDGYKQIGLPGCLNVVKGVQCTVPSVKFDA